MPRIKLSALTLAFFAVLITSCGPAPEADNTSGEMAKQGQAYVVDETSKPNILQIAAGSDDHSTLVAAVQAAELENVLVNAGPLTVFAPTNEAFDKLPAGTVDELLKPENKTKLGKIITSHAAPGTYQGDLLKDGTKLYQATGHYVDVEVKDGETFVNGAKILATVDASNGVVHVVDQVFLLVE